MTVTELVTALVALQRKGFGDLRVIDDNGNDVMAVHPPAPAAEVHEGQDPDGRDVMLSCYIDYGKVEA